jgi:hypothetical protein
LQGPKQEVPLELQVLGYKKAKLQVLQRTLVPHMTLVLQPELVLRMTPLGLLVPHKTLLVLHKTPMLHN